MGLDALPPFRMMINLIFLHPDSDHNMASKLPSVLSATEEEIQLLLAAQCHIGTKNCDKQMQPYVWKRRADGGSFTFVALTASKPS